MAIARCATCTPLSQHEGELRGVSKPAATTCAFWHLQHRSGPSSSLAGASSVSQLNACAAGASARARLCACQPCSPSSSLRSRSPLLQLAAAATNDAGRRSLAARALEFGVDALGPGLVCAGCCASGRAGCSRPCNPPPPTPAPPGGCARASEARQYRTPSSYQTVVRAVGLVGRTTRSRRKDVSVLAEGKACVYETLERPKYMCASVARAMKP